MMAYDLHWMPDTLHNSCITAVATHHFAGKSFHNREEISRLPPCVQFDIFYKAFQIGKLSHVASELHDLWIFKNLLICLGNRRRLLHQIFQALMDNELHLSTYLQHSYVTECEDINKDDETLVKKLISTGLVLNNFLAEAGWYDDCEKILEACVSLCQIYNEPYYWSKALECCVRLLHVQISFYKFLSADSTVVQSNYYMNKLSRSSLNINKATIYSQFTSLYFNRSLYDKSYGFSLKALEELTESLPKTAIIDVLRQTGKVCLIKRKFTQAELVLHQAVCHARDHFGTSHFKYSDALLDYSYFLLNIDNVCQAVQCYTKCLNIRTDAFGGTNLHVATAHENLAYATYVHEYSSGKFTDASLHANRAMKILTKILPCDHMLVASCRRVKALILEEIAIDNSNDSDYEQKLLSEALELHNTALNQSLAMFGENNVQTAKHYGNLGRLYQSMKKYEEAEKMHLKAIEIKERLLTNDNHEVALSVGHLASLYNYDLDRYDEAEQLYLRSIAIGKSLFGEKYSGLEYDYRGLHRLFTQRGEIDKANDYSLILQEWLRLREADAQEQENVAQLLSKPSQTVEQLKARFFLLEAEGINPTRSSGS